MVRRLGTHFVRGIQPGVLHGMRSRNYCFQLHPQAARPHPRGRGGVHRAEAARGVKKTRRDKTMQMNKLTWAIVIVALVVGSYLYINKVGRYTKISQLTDERAYFTIKGEMEKFTMPPFTDWDGLYYPAPTDWVRIDDGTGQMVILSIHGNFQFYLNKPLIINGYVKQVGLGGITDETGIWIGAAIESYYEPEWWE